MINIKIKSFKIILLVSTIVISCLLFVFLLPKSSENNFSSVISPFIKDKLDEDNRNAGVIKIRAIIANIDEVGDKYGSMGEKFNQSKISETKEALLRLNAFVKSSSYRAARLNWEISGVHELGVGVCDHETYGEKVDDLINRALQKEDAKNPIDDYSFFIIIHPMPDCSDGVIWSFEGRGNFKPYNLNGRIVHLRGIHISDLSEDYLFHEFGHTLAYKEGTGIGHPGYLSCPIKEEETFRHVLIKNNCEKVYDDGQLPIYTMMSGKRGILSDYNVIEKETAGWLPVRPTTIVSSIPVYKLKPFEKDGSSLVMPIEGTNYTAYITFRQPLGFKYPNAPAEKPNGVIIEVKHNSTQTDSFLITNATDNDKPLDVGVSYRFGESDLIIKVESINNSFAKIRVSSKSNDGGFGSIKMSGT